MSTPHHLLCGECAKLNLQRLDFDQPPFIPEDKYHKVIREGNVEQLKKHEHSCKLCSLILHALQLNAILDAPDLLDDVEWELEWQQNCDEYDPKDDGAEDLYGSGLYARLKTGGTSDYCIQLIEEIGSQKLLRGRLITETVDLNMARKWIKMCKEQHPESCNPLATSPARKNPDGLVCIDVKNLCLCPIESEDEYIALSYVWGPNNYPRTTKGRVQEFSKPGAFSNISLPQTIADAIELTKDLGYQFLWTDSLCIIQDADNEKLKLINLMDVIYSQADVTIVVASSNTAQSGIVGLNLINGKAGRSIKTATIGSGLHLGILPSFDREMMDSFHATRGWT